MMLFSFEADTLEISLREIQDVVDHIFIVESSRTHRGVFWREKEMVVKNHFSASQATGVGKTEV